MSFNALFAGLESWRCAWQILRSMRRSRQKIDAISRRGAMCGAPWRCAGLLLEGADEASYDEIVSAMTGREWKGAIRLLHELPRGDSLALDCVI